MEININSYLDSFKERHKWYKRNDLASNQEGLARTLQYLYVCCTDTMGRYKCKKCGEYTCSEQDEKNFKFCPRCGEKLKEN